MDKTETRTYSKEDADRAVRRHARRTPEERLVLLRAMLCEAAGDCDPAFAGVDPDRGPYEGDPIWFEALSMLAYFTASRLTPIGEREITEETERRILRAVGCGISMARHHKTF